MAPPFGLGRVAVDSTNGEGREAGVASRRESVSVITGGLGYVGQSLAAVLRQTGRVPVLVDRRSVPNRVEGARVITGSIADAEVWRHIGEQYQVEVVYHCAGLIVVPESVADPGPYFRHNVAASIAMLDHVRQLGDSPVVFSSSAAVYGTPDSVPIEETAPKRPLSPYGVTKWQFEQVLEAYGHAYGVKWVALRYFNVSGSVEGVVEQHHPETHLMPLVATALAAGRMPVIYGEDYPTPDGTAIRDYVHMEDLVAAHLQAALYLQQGGTSQPFNLGSGRGHSVREVIEGFARVTGRPIHPVIAPRRPGDPPILVADIARAGDVLGWRPRHSARVDRMIAETWKAIAQS